MTLLLFFSLISLLIAAIYGMSQDISNKTNSHLGLFMLSLIPATLFLAYMYQKGVEDGIKNKAKYKMVIETKTKIISDTTFVIK